MCDKGIEPIQDFHCQIVALRPHSHIFLGFTPTEYDIFIPTVDLVTSKIAMKYLHDELKNTLTIYWNHEALCQISPKGQNWVSENYNTEYDLLLKLQM